jgi:2-polyprenyl-3-methyl-5-hydroxy-6-metoxy-1,4-benzoquinol methylase
MIVSSSATRILIRGIVDSSAVSTCCARGYERFFGARTARRDARRYRRKGLDKTARLIVDELAKREIAGATVLEIGGGIGAIGLELLKLGAARVEIVELSHGYDDEAKTLLAESGFEGRVERLHGDFVVSESDIPPADVVVLHRVVCCYPDPDTLVGAAARHARRLMALSFPRDTWWLRAGSRVANVFFRRVGWIESFVHPHETILDPARAEGFEAVYEHEGRLWQVAVLERS